MNIFISWSKPRAKKLASALRSWLPDVIQAANPFMSEQDIAAGADWSGNIHDQLQLADFGLVCVTAENQLEPWLNYETGALVNAEKKPLVCPLLLGVRASDLTGPMKKFQSKEATQAGVLSVLQSINAVLPDEIRLEDQRLERIFARTWEDLRQKIADIEPVPDDVPRVRDPNEMIGETLDTVREVARQLSGLSTALERVNDIASRVRATEPIIYGDAGRPWPHLMGHRDIKPLNIFTAHDSMLRPLPLGTAVIYDGGIWTIRSGPKLGSRGIVYELEDTRGNKLEALMSSVIETTAPRPPKTGSAPSKRRVRAKVKKKSGS